MRILSCGARVSARVLLALSTIAVRHARAQTGTYSGSVYRDSLDHPLAETDILVQRGSTSFRAVTDAKGDVKRAQRAVGKYAVVFRHVGFEPLIDRIEVAVGGGVDRAYEIVPMPVQLARERERHDDEIRIAKTAGVPRANEDEHRRTLRRHVTRGYHVDW